MTITSSTGSMILDDDATPSIDDMNEIISSVTNEEQFIALCDASTAWPKTLTNAEFLAMCEAWVAAQ